MDMSYAHWHTYIPFILIMLRQEKSLEDFTHCLFLDSSFSESRLIIKAPNYKAWRYLQFICQDQKSQQAIIM